jgi:hypothetical protein
MKFKTAKLLSFLCLITSSLVCSSAQSETRTVAFSQVKGWDVETVYDAESSNFSFCSGSRIQPDRTYFMIILNWKGEWSLSLFNDNWSGRSGTQFRVDLYVDGRPVDRNYATWVAGNQAIIQFGSSLSSITALMNGNVLTIVSEGGQSPFSLGGSYAAALKVADCYATQRQLAANPRGAFSTPQQANDAQISGGSSNLKTASRAETLEWLPLISETRQ